ncbi:class I SAM-dependent methyltransferase [Luteimonas sp. XNQY3]|nr:class I SAM-dependent methyltransferase [Luteimonas sp. XNQY3]MCD9007492.1 class I SAM-dependent methyltransferase [Luteimonas sp. XNQY3]
MMERLCRRAPATVLDVGCGEGRFCRRMQQTGIATVGVDPVDELIAEARRNDPAGDYRIGRAEALDFTDGAFDAVVSYLTLIDIPDIAAAIGEMARVLRPGGMLLIANLTSFSTASTTGGWSTDEAGEPQFCIDRYLDERDVWVEMRGIRIRNWHRPLGTYMRLLLDQGLILRHFDEPVPYGGDPDRVDRYRRVPWLLMMEWEKPAAA